MHEELVQAMTNQYTLEVASANLYLQMSAWLTSKGWLGAAHWTMIQYQEEMAHAQGFYDYIANRNAYIKLQAIPAPEKASWDQPLEVFQDILAHEEKITKSIQDLSDLAQKLQDRAASLFLDWYVLEQVEEEGNANANVDQYTIAGTNPAALRMIDQDLASRTFTPPVIPHTGAPAPQSQLGV